MKKNELLEKAAAGALSPAELDAETATKLRSEIAADYRTARADDAKKHADETRQMGAAIRQLDQVIATHKEFADLDEATVEQQEAAADATAEGDAAAADETGDLVGAAAGTADAGATATAATASADLPAIPTGRTPEAPKGGRRKRTAMVAAASDVTEWSTSAPELTRAELAARIAAYTRSLQSDGRGDIATRVFAHVAAYDIAPNDGTKRLLKGNTKDQNSAVIKWADEHQIEAPSDNVAVGRVAAWNGIAEHDFSVETNFERRVELWDKIRKVPAGRATFNFRPKVVIPVLTSTTAFETKAGIQDLDSTAVQALDGASNKVLVTDLPTVSTETAVDMKVWTRAFRYQITDEIVDPEGLQAQMQVQDALYEIFQDALTYRWLYDDSQASNGVNLTGRFAPTVGGFPGFVQAITQAKAGRGWNKRIDVKGYTAIVPAGIKDLFIQDELIRAYTDISGISMSNFDRILNDIGINILEVSQDQLNAGLNALESPIADGLLVPTFSPSGNISTGSANVTVASTAGYVPGMTVSGTGIPAGAYILSITSATVFVLSANATATNASAALTIKNAAMVQPALDGTAIPNQVIRYIPVILARFDDWRVADWGVEDWGVDKQFHQDQMRVRHQRAAMFEKFKVDSTLPTIQFTLDLTANGGRAGTVTPYSQTY